MGIILSRFRRKKETVERLEELDERIKKRINFRLENQESQRRWVGRITLWGLIGYVLFALLYYLIYFPEAWIGSKETDVERILYSAALIVFPVIALVASRRTLTWYYARRITYNEEKLLELKEEKKTILEEVMENETYKKAKEILEKFDPDKQKTMTPPRMLSNRSTPASSPAPESALRQRKGDNVLAAKPFLAPQPPSSPALAIGPPPGTPVSGPGMNGTILRPPNNTPVRASNPRGPYIPGGRSHPVTKFTPRALIPNSNRGPVLPRPVLPADRGLMDRMVEYLVGDGPSNRYALICRRCNRHNGMALKEEFEYISFHCAYCFFLNPAKRKRPSAPRLPDSNPTSGRESEADSEAESTTSGASPRSPLSVDKKLHNGDGETTTQSIDRAPTFEETDEDVDKAASETASAVGESFDAKTTPVNGVDGAVEVHSAPSKTDENDDAHSDERRQSSTDVDDDYVKVSNKEVDDSEDLVERAEDETPATMNPLETSAEPMEIAS